MAERFLIRLAAEAERDFLLLPPAEREHLRTVMEGIAEVAALAPPHFPAWFKRHGMSLPLMRVTVSGRRISYELDCDDCSLRICGIELHAEPLQFHGP